MLRVSFVRSVLPALLLVGVAVSGVSAQVEPIIPSKLIALKAQPTEADLDAIRQYTEFWAGQMGLAQEDAEVAQARRKLTEPLTNASATDAFKTQYSPLCATAVLRKNLHRHKKVSVRMNALIVAGRLTDGMGLDLAKRLIKDKQFAVRYWAAAAIAQATAGELPKPKIADAIDAVEAVVRGEQDYLIRIQLYTALNHIGDVNINDAGDENIRAVTTLVGAMQHWVEHYAKSGLTDGVDAEAKAFPKLHRNVIYLWLAQRDKMEGPLKAYATVSGRFVRLVAGLLNQFSDDRVKSISVDLVGHCETAMNYAVRKFNTDRPDDQPGPALKAALLDNNLNAFKDAMFQWVGGVGDGLLTTEKIAIPRKDLELEVTAAPPAPPADATASNP